jgi:imidazolonepropionase-like amidohydrolase
MNMSVRCLLLVLVACGAPAPAPSATPAPATPAVALQPGDIAITNVSVVPMSRDGVLEHQTVVVRGDRIVAVVPSAQLAVPPTGRTGITATTIDGSNKWLMPGLADMHVHTWNENDFTLFLAAGVTTIRNMFGSDQHLAWRTRIARGDILGPTIVTAGPIIDGDPPIWPGSAVIDSPAQAEAIVADQKAKGYDFLKAYSRLSREGYQALMAAAARHGMTVAGHVPTAVGLEGVLAANQKSVEHVDGWLLALVPESVTLPSEGSNTAKLRVALPRLDAGRLPGLIARTIAAGTWNCPTLVVLDRIAALDNFEAIKRHVKWLDKVPHVLVAQWDPRQDFRFKGFTAEDYATMRAANVWRARIVAALAAANAPLLVGTDTGNPFVIPGEALHDEIELMVAAGVPRARVLRAATADAAIFLGTPHEAGVVEVGARADLVLVSTNPLTTPLPLVPDGVMVRGKWLPRADLEARLADVTRHVNEPPRENRWETTPPLVGEGKIVHQAHYDMSIAGEEIGEERFAVGMVGKDRLIVGQQVAEFGGPVETSYRIGPDLVTLAVKSPFGALQVTGKVTAGTLVVTGTDRTGKPVSLHTTMPADAFLSGPGIGGTQVLAAKVAGMKVGDKRALRAVDLSYFPEIVINSASYDVERKPDANGHHVFAVATRLGGNAASGEMVLDDGGFVVGQTIGPPVNLKFERRP